MAFVLSSSAALFAGARQSLGRFPVPVISALLFAMLALVYNHDLAPELGDDRIGRLLLMLAFGFFAALAAGLFAEARFWPAGLGHGLGAALALLFLIAARPDLSHADWQIWAWSWASFVAPALILAVMVAPSLGGDWDNRRFWDFNRAAWLAAAFACLTAAILFLGLQATLFALETLLEIPISHRATTDISILSFSLLWPWLALGGVPTRAAVGRDDPPPAWLGFLVRWLLVPLVIVYLAVIYAYVIKILLQWQLPDGEVGWVISGYAAAGVAVHLIAAPWRDEGPLHVRAFQRWFYPALFIPAAVLALAAWQRVEAYGVTEARYLLLLFAAWLFFLTTVYSFGVRRLLLAPLSLALLLLAAAFGPWSAGEISARSQFARLERALIVAGLLNEGKITAAKRQLDFADAKSISSRIAFFTTRDRQDRLAAWFNQLKPEAADKVRNFTADEFMAALGVRFIRSWEVSPSFNYHATSPTEQDVAGFQYLYQFELFMDTEDNPTARIGPFQFSYDTDSKTVAIADEAGHRATVDLSAWVEELLVSTVTPPVTEKERFMLSKDTADGPLRLRVTILSLRGGETTEGIEISGGEIQLLVGTTPAPVE